MEKRNKFSSAVVFWQLFGVGRPSPRRLPNTIRFIEFSTTVTFNTNVSNILNGAADEVKNKLIYFSWYHLKQIFFFFSF